MFTHRFSGTHHQCGELIIRQSSFSFVFKDDQKAIEIGKNFDTFCFFNITPKISRIFDGLDDSDSESESDSDDENPRALQLSNQYSLTYSFEHEISLDNVRMIIKTLRKAPLSKMYFTESCLDELTKAVEQFFQEKSLSVKGCLQFAKLG